MKYFWYVFRDEIKQTLGEIIQNVLWHSIALRLSGKEACPTCKGTLIPPIWSKLSYYLQKKLFETLLGIILV